MSCELRVLTFDFFEVWDAIVGGSGTQTKAQLEVVALQQQQEKDLAALKYDPERLAEQRRLFQMIGFFLLTLILLFFLYVKYIR